MKVIKNNSQAQIKVNIMVIKPGNQTQSFDLAYGEYVVVDDSSIATKSIILQQKKRNIEVLDEVPENISFYQKHSSFEPLQKETVQTETQVEVETTYEEPTKITTVESVSIPVEKNKGGRPKGALNKKKKKKSKKTKPAENLNESQENQ